MRKYLHRVKSQEPHHRRQHAMQLAGIATVAVFAVWITTLGFRLGGTNLADDNTNNQSLSATAAQSLFEGPNQLIVASSTQY